MQDDKDMTDEQPKAEAPAVAEAPPQVAAIPTDEDFIFRLKDQPSIKVELMNGEIKEFPSDVVAMELLEAGLGTKEISEDRLESTKTVLAIVEKAVGEPVGMAMSWAIVNQASALVRKYAKKAASTSDSDTTSDSGQPNTSAPAP